MFWKIRSGHCPRYPEVERHMRTLSETRERYEETGGREERPWLHTPSEFRHGENTVGHEQKDRPDKEQYCRYPSN